MNQIEKNRLDLAYKRQLCFLNFILTIGIGTIISLFIGLIINLENWWRYSVAFVVIGSLVYLTYSNIDDNLKDISLKIGELKNN